MEVHLVDMERRKEELEGKLGEWREREKMRGERRW